MIILIGSQKGGCGKSTLATNIAASLSYDYDVVLLDADEQGTSAQWAADREDTDYPTVHCLQKFGNIAKTATDLATRYDQVVIDAAGRDSQELRSGLVAADYVLCPFRPSQPDIDTAQALSDVIDQANTINASLRAFGVLAMCPTNPAINEISEAQEALAGVFPLVSSLIHDRKAYRDSISLGGGVIESKNAKAKAEIKQLMVQIYG